MPSPSGRHSDHTPAPLSTSARTDIGPTDAAPNGPAPTAPVKDRKEWFDDPDPNSGEAGLRFSCTMCGNCCTGPEGYVLVNDAEIASLARRFELTPEVFIERYTHMTPPGRSLIEKVTSFGNDCVFLDRDRIPGKAVCGVYEDRPAQCRTWPFWTSILQSRRTWERFKRTCPGMDTGTRYTPLEIRVKRAVIEM